jgi:hypothetical protein
MPWANTPLWRLALGAGRGLGRSLFPHARDADDQHVIALDVRDVRQRVPVGHQPLPARSALTNNRHRLFDLLGRQDLKKPRH